MPATDTALPVRRPDLIVRPVDDEGQHVVKDPRTGGYFKLGPQESFLFEHLDGRHGADEVRRAFSRRFNEPLADEDVKQFVTLAEESGFLAAPPSARPVEPAPAPRLKPLDPRPAAARRS